MQTFKPLAPTDAIRLHTNRNVYDGGIMLVLMAFGNGNDEVLIAYEIVAFHQTFRREKKKIPRERKKKDFERKDCKDLSIN